MRARVCGVRGEDESTEEYAVGAAAKEHSAGNARVPVALAQELRKADSPGEVVQLELEGECEVLLVRRLLAEPERRSERFKERFQAIERNVPVPVKDVRGSKSNCEKDSHEI